MGESKENALSPEAEPPEAEPPAEELPAEAAGALLLQAAMDRDITQARAKASIFFMGRTSKKLLSIFYLFSYLYRARNRGRSSEMGALLSMSWRIRSSLAAIFRHCSRTGSASS